MRSRQPPAAATWLLRKFGCTNDALKGDLAEEYGQGRSIAWYWRQVFVAIVVGFNAEVSANKLLALRSIVTGWMTTYLLGDVVGTMFWKWYGRLLLARGLLPTFWWRHFYTYPVAAMWCICALASGWVVGKSHREHSGAMVLIFLASVQLWSLPELIRLAENAATNQRFVPYLFAFITRLVFVSTGISVGGLLGASSQSDTRRS